MSTKGGSVPDDATGPRVFCLSRSRSPEPVSPFGGSNKSPVAHLSLEGRSSSLRRCRASCCRELASPGDPADLRGNPCIPSRGLRHSSSVLLGFSSGANDSARCLHCLVVGPV